MATTMSKADYLKRYLSGGDSEVEKKKKKSKKKTASSAQGMRIYEDDAFASVSAAKSKDVESDVEEEEMKIIDEIKKKSDKMPMFKKAFGEEVVPKNEPLSEPSSPAHNGARSSGRDHSPPRRRRHDSSDDNSPPRRQRHDSDASPPRRKRHDSDDRSPPRKQQRREDNSPPRRKRHDSDVSPPRRKRHDSDDQSPPRRQQRDPDNSPPRRRRHDSDASPPRRRREPSASPPRQQRRRHDSDNSPPRHRRQDSDDQSPPRQRRRNDSSPPRRREIKKEVDSDQSPPRKRSNKNDDLSPPRRGRAEVKQEVDSDQSPERKTGGQRTLDGKMFENLDVSRSGRGAETVVRKKQYGKRNIDDEEKKAKREREMKKTAELAEKHKDLNAGIYQKQQRERKLEEMARVAAEPMARAADDEAMNEHLKGQIIEEHDPMAALIMSKRRENAIDRGELVYPTYKGAFLPNRFGIRPGYRWDGVDRSNGFEGKMAVASNRKKAQDTEFYANIHTYE